MDLNNFGPFPVVVWGSVAEWAIVLLTSLTGLGVYYTLKSQMEVQELEAKNNEMTTKQYKRTILPFMLYKDLYLNSMFDQWHIQFAVIQNIAFSVKVIDPQEPEWNLMPPQTESSPVGYTFHVGISADQYNDTNVPHLFTLKFKDLDGNTYTQRVYKRHGKYETSYPERWLL